MELAGGVVGGRKGVAGMVPVPVVKVKGVGVRGGRSEGAGRVQVQRGAGLVVRGAASEKVSSLEGQEPKGGVVKGVLFDMDGVLCDSEKCSRRAGVEMFAEMGYTVQEEDFLPFTGTGNSVFCDG